MNKHKVAQASLRLDAAGMPKTISLTHPFGFMHNGVLRSWDPGKAITNAEDIALLFRMKAPIEGYDYD